MCVYVRVCRRAYVCVCVCVYLGADEASQHVAGTLGFFFWCVYRS